MSKKIVTPGIDFYQRNTRFKWVVLAVSILISAGSIYYTKILVDQLKGRERQQVHLYAKAIEYTAKEQDPYSDVNFIAQELLFQNKSIPIILADGNGNVLSSRNLFIDSTWSENRTKSFLKKEMDLMRETYEPITVTLRDPQTNEVFGTQYIYYKNSSLLTQIIAYPYIQLSVIAIFGFIAYMAFNYSKAAEQNRVWVGLAKETAHQLGTPLSSLMAWVEVIREDADMREKGVVEELEKDIQKLRIVTERFSSIGSTPTLKQENVVALIHNVVNYLRPRVSSKIKIEVYTLSESIIANVHAPLFEWVIENLCKNAVDAMGNSGVIAIKILRGSENKVFIDVSDTGKGIPRSKLETVFRPGFTTKKRGWGLGLTLAKRIIDTYHNGKIFVKASEENQGTTFRISINAVTH
ncbi:sensor histidine kinase [Pseudochryseolinea flava]|uniref:histidine kinase n=1 Tax=Pseudochryseolinea flava TaxID=2059302 RepID=A0A364YAM3_9BACT|nr:HAMP domain-containing sensor histidine kinase [Pseudochryseolinea flava]RAW03425.1 histidine kinase [Pseudochryseolinea flava]